MPIRMLPVSVPDPKVRYDEAVATALEIPRKVWTREDAHSLADLGFPNASKLELINGELIDHMGKKRPHAIWQHLIQAWLQTTFGVEYVQMESPIDVSSEDNLLNEPEPDLMVTAKRSREYDTNPNPPELRLIVEVSDSTVSFDLKWKAPLYARAGIVEYWVIDIPERLVHVHREPLLGRYASVVKYGFHADINPLARPEAVFCAERL
jgi:Uma2 family endonuclease